MSREGRGKGEGWEGEDRVLELWVLSFRVSGKIVGGAKMRGAACVPIPLANSLA